MEEVGQRRRGVEVDILIVVEPRLAALNELRSIGDGRGSDAGKPLLVRDGDCVGSGPVLVEIVDGSVPTIGAGCNDIGDVGDVVDDTPSVVGRWQPGKMRPMREAEDVGNAVATLVKAKALRLGRTQPARVAHAWIAVRIGITERKSVEVNDRAARRAGAEGPRAVVAEEVGPVGPRLHFVRRKVVAEVGKAIAVVDAVGTSSEHIAVNRVAARVDGRIEPRPRRTGNDDGRSHAGIGVGERIVGVDRLGEQRRSNLLRDIHTDRLAASIATSGRLLRRRSLAHSAGAAHERRCDDHQQHQNRRHKDDGVTAARAGSGWSCRVRMHDEAFLCYRSTATATTRNQRLGRSTMNWKSRPPSMRPSGSCRRMVMRMALGSGV